VRPECSGSLFTSLDRFQAAIVRSKRRSTPPQLHERFAGAPGCTRRSHLNGEHPESAAHRTTSRCENGGSGGAVPILEGEYIDASRVLKR
jgi:hypothetical protein